MRSSELHLKGMRVQSGWNLPLDISFVNATSFGGEAPQIFCHHLLLWLKHQRHLDERYLQIHLFSLHQNVRTSYGAHSTSYSMNSMDTYHWGCGRRVKLRARLELELGLRMSGAAPSLRPTLSWLVQVQLYLYTRFSSNLEMDSWFQGI